MRNPSTTLLTLLLAILISACATLPDNSDRAESYHLGETHETSLAKSVAPRLAQHPGESGAYPMESGLDAFVARALTAHSAEKTLDVQYYLYHDDKIGSLLTDQLLKAADRGVRVRLLLDDMDLADRDFGGSIIDAHPNIELRIFNPFSRNTFRATQFVTRFGGVTRRMHNKTYIVDNSIAIVGGRNIGDEYFDASKEYTFSDLDVILIGPAVSKVSESFDLYWNNSLSYPLATLNKNKPKPSAIAERRAEFSRYIESLQGSEYIQALKDSALATTIRNNSLSYFWGDVDIVYDHPDKIIKSRSETKYHLSSDLADYFGKVKKELILISPYFVPGKSGVSFLSELVAKGLSVSVITNSLSANDVPAVHAGYMKYRKKLLQNGVNIYEFKTYNKAEAGEAQLYGDLLSGLHAKSFVLDREYVFIGSMNLDPRSAKENTEIGAMIQSEALADLFYSSIIDELDERTYKVYLEGGKLHWKTLEEEGERVFTKEPNTTWWQRFSVGAMRIIPAESQL
ncbi:Phosphatidylserine/phosphatidylglycerophosphate/cardiolipin synthase [Alteromonadaceae bacterium Bs31]|nr:Phosphatidylserine/phosphatidylglycerophosphate/cardiolipin synthase [Alteromonadaceae bacterium Bs31]